MIENLYHRLQSGETIHAVNPANGLKFTIQAMGERVRYIVNGKATKGLFTQAICDDWQQRIDEVKGQNDE
jgi:hypothetical protein